MTADNNNADSIVEASADDLRTEIDRLHEDNADLRASALRWKGLYEAVIAETRDSGADGVTRRPARRRAVPVEISVDVTSNDDSSRVQVAL